MKKEKKEYINIHKNYLELLDLLTKKDTFFSDGAHLIRFAVSLGLAAKTELDSKISSELRREDGARNFKSTEIDKEEQITFIISEITGELEKKYSKMEELANIGFDLIKDKYIDSDTLIIDWDKIAKDIS